MRCEDHNRLAREDFKLPAAPTLPRRAVELLLEEALDARHLAGAKVLLADSPLHRRTLFDVAGRRVEFPEGRAYDRCFIALVDPQPDARWAHDAHFAFVPADGDGAVAWVETNLPPHGEVVARFLELAQHDP